MSHHVVLNRKSGAGDGYRDDLPLVQEVEQPIFVDGRRLGHCHPMFLVRLRLFLDWHIAAGHEVSFAPPLDAAVAQELSASGLADGLPPGVTLLPPRASLDERVLGIRNLRSADDVEDVAAAAMDMLGAQVPALAVWGDPAYMAVSELCGNALLHGRDALGAYVAADQIVGQQRQFRLAIADLGLGIPEHIRAQHPEWLDDTAAIARALQRGVSGTGDPHRGNGFAEVFDDTLAKVLTRSGSAVEIDLRSGKGRVVVELINDAIKPRPGQRRRARRGTWITYVVKTV